jgi:hypothetical protein
MSALESLLDHCLKPLPSGKCCKLVKEGARAMLYISQYIYMVTSMNRLTVGQYHLIFYWLHFLDVLP